MSRRPSPPLHDGQAKRNEPSRASGRKRDARRNPQVEGLEARCLLAVLSTTVTSAADSGAGTLRQAIINSNSLGGRNLIDFDLGNVVARNETAVPTAYSGPQGITTGPDKNLWFAELNSSKIARITPGPGGIVTEFTTPTPSSQPTNITVGPDNNLWFTEQAVGKIGRITTAGAVTEFSIPGGSGNTPYGITSGPDGNLWFTELGVDRIGRITTAGAITEFNIPTAGAFPFFVTQGPDGNLWFTEGAADKIGRITTAGAITEFNVPTAGATPEGITTGPDGALWFTETNSGSNKIGRITTAGVVTNEYTVPTPNSTPETITAAPDGFLYFTEYTGNKIGRISTAGVIFESQPLPTAGSQPFGITPGPDGNIYFTEQSGNKVGFTGGLSIQPATGLPSLSVPADVDGTTNPGYAGTPIVELNGVAVGSGVNGLTITNGAGGLPRQGSTVRGLVINHFTSGQVAVNAPSGGTIIDNNDIGTDRTGTAVFTNTANGVLIDGSSGNQIGDPANGGKGNVISGNGLAGVFLLNGSNNNNVQGNLIGTDAGGNFALGNVQYGVEIGRTGGTGNTIGGTFNGARNVISGKTSIAGIVFFPGADGNFVQGNLIGTDITGTRSTDAKGKTFGNSVGIAIGSGSDMIGGLTTAAANVIANSAIDGVQFIASATGNTLQGNFIGTNAASSTTLGNAGVGVLIKQSSINNTIGGTAGGAGNTIANNRSGGVTITGGGTTGNQVQGNFIGTNASLAPGLGNFGSGVLISVGASSNPVGGAANGAGNTIAFNSSNGVTVGSSASDSTTLGNALLSNSIFSNSGLGIDLGNDGVTPNTQTGPNSGPNAFQNTPVITSATVASGNTTVAGTLNSDANATFTIQLFSNPAADPSGSGQGKTLLATAPSPLTVTTDGSGKATFSTTVAGDLTGQVVSATATSASPASNTSEFAPDVTVAQAVNLTISKAGPATVFDGSNLTYTVTVGNTGGGNATGVNVTDALPAGLTYVSATSTQNGTPVGTVSQSNGVVTDAVPGIASNAPPVILTIVAHANNTATLSNSARVTSAQTGPTAFTSNTVTTTVNPTTDLTVTKTTLGTNVAGTDLTYTVTAGNNGPDNATGVVLTDTLPAGVTLASFPTTTQGTVTVANGVVTDTVGALAARGNPVTLIFMVSTPRSPAPLTNTANVTGNEFDNDLTNNKAIKVTPLSARTDLAVSSSTPGSVPAGSPLTYTVKVTNAGPSNATGVVLTDTLPAGATLVGMPTSTQNGVPVGTVSQSNGVITDTIGTLAPGPIPVTLTFMVVPSQPGSDTNTASVAGNEIDTDTTNNAVTNVTPVTVAAVTNFTVTPLPAFEGKAFVNRQVATFSDGNPFATPGEFQALIDWGDRTTSAGRVTQPGGPGSQFVVVGDHTYRALGSFPVTVTLTDLGGKPATANGVATVSSAGFIVTAGDITAVEGAPFSGPVATFVAASPYTAPGDFAATINWGDTQVTSPGTVTQPGGPGMPFVVLGEHTFPEESTPGTPYPLTVTVTRVSTGETPPATPGTATVADAALSIQGVPVTATAGAPLTGVPVATFTDLGGPESIGNYSTTIRWENGAPTPGTLVRTGTMFTVLGSHTFAGPGTFPVSVTVRHAGLSGFDTTAVSSASVAPLPLPARTNRYVIGPIDAAAPGSPMRLHLNLNGTDQPPIALTPGGGLVINGSTADDVFTVNLGNLANPAPIRGLPFTLTVNGLGGRDAFNVQSLPNVSGLLVTLDGNSTTSPASTDQGDTLTLPPLPSATVTAYDDPYTYSPGSVADALRLDFGTGTGTSIALRDFGSIPVIRASMVTLNGDFNQPPPGTVPSLAGVRVPPAAQRFNRYSYADQITVTGTGTRQFVATINPAITGGETLRFASPRLSINGRTRADTITVKPYAGGPWNVALGVDGGNNLNPKSSQGQPLPGDVLVLVDRSTSPSQIAVKEGGSTPRNPFSYTHLDSIVVTARVGVPVLDTLLLSDSNHGNSLDVNLGASGSPTDPFAFFHEGTSLSLSSRTAVSSTTVDNNLGVQVYNGSHVINVVLTNPPAVRRTLSVTGDGTDRVQFTDLTGGAAKVLYVGYGTASGVIQVRFGNQKRATYNIPYTNVKITTTIFGPKGAPNGNTVSGPTNVPKGPRTAGQVRGRSSR